jgi:toxin secretion/phage lysis holin
MIAVGFFYAKKEVFNMEFIREISFTHRYWILFLPLFLMAADVITGWIQATINETWDSTKMRVGLYRKSGEILVIVIAYVIYAAINLPIDMPAFIAGYIIIMEIISVAENLDEAGLPVPRWVTRRLKKVADDLSEDEDPDAKYWDDEEDEE